ncbi:MAG TPA: hypothetical protein VHT96_06145 [Clostridia bacterium]|nr:hypothetical protein [Clostridia bacterium]
MYENVTYAELKGLPKEQKTEALKELKTLYKTQKELAGKLGVSPNLLYNMMARYVKDRPVESEETGEPEALEKPGMLEKPVKTRRRLQKQTIEQTVQKQRAPKQRMQRQKLQEQASAAPEILTLPPETKDETFSISIKKTVSGEEAQVFLNGIGVTLLKGQQYAVEVKITEK